MHVVRTVFICLVGFSACFASSLSAGQDKELGINSRSPMTTMTAKNYSVAPEVSNVYIDKNNESRAITGGRIGEQVSKELSDASLALSHTPSLTRSISSDRIERAIEGLEAGTPPLTRSISSDRIERAIERLEAVTSPEAISMLNEVAIVLGNAKWRNLIEAMDISWEVEIIRKLVLAHCLHARESPAHTFRYMRVDLMHFSADTQRYDPKLLWWLDYVEQYRQLVGVRGLVRSAKSDAATNYEVFDDKELFAFLVNEYELQAKKVTSPAIRSPEMTPPDPQYHVVALFEWLRHQSNTEKLAEGMQLFLVSKTNAVLLVFHEWLQGRVSPKIVYDILSVVPYDNEGVFPLWLKYIEMYWNNVFSGPDEHYFYYDVFLSFLAEKSSWNDVKSFLYSGLFYQIFDEAPQFGFGTHAKNLQTMLVRWHWLHYGATPKVFFKRLKASGKFEIGDLEFLQGILFVDLYREKKRFINEELYTLLRKTHSLEEIVGLFQWLQKDHYWGMEKIISGMLKYLQKLSIRRRVTKTLQQEGHLQKKRKRSP